jgi:hypothetical protein
MVVRRGRAEDVPSAWLDHACSDHAAAGAGSLREREPTGGSGAGAHNAYNEAGPDRESSRRRARVRAAPVTAAAGARRDPDLNELVDLYPGQHETEPERLEKLA